MLRSLLVTLLVAAALTVWAVGYEPGGLSYGDLEAGWITAGHPELLSR